MSSPVLSLPTSQAQFSDRMRSWSPPAIGHVKLNTDASFEHKNAIAGLGIVMRNATGYLIDGCAVSRPVVSSGTSCAQTSGTSTLQIFKETSLFMEPAQKA
ncbi:hypothetical protein GH714_010185 [Hevea brasiliensis]|uniref:RNase H type-1 domain-containing protein n=1 Tax=Hevea brasiliensis TaxID=3981 RepID=A0A6A6MK07_HEVBR|nr:hypothetical protein GH714_010185 [Hevea brasiliensis]